MCKREKDRWVRTWEIKCFGWRDASSLHHYRDFDKTVKVSMLIPHIFSFTRECWLEPVPPTP